MKKNVKYVRKSIVLKKKLKKRNIYFANLTTKRPGTGISPMNFFKLIGKKSKKNYFEDDLI